LQRSCASPDQKHDPRSPHHAFLAGGLALLSYNPSPRNNSNELKPRIGSKGRQTQRAIFFTTFYWHIPCVNWWDNFRQMSPDDHFAAARNFLRHQLLDLIVQ
jgi:hypothetical protein